MRECVIDDCHKIVIARGWCHAHYKKWQKYGDPLETKPRYPEPHVRLWNNVETVGECWLWKGYTNPKGYGRFNVYGRYTLVHIYAYTRYVGDIPEPLEVDHICHNRNCIKPSHLQLKTHQQNTENRKGATQYSSSGYRGVHKNQANSSKPWRAVVMVNGVKHRLGDFDDPEDAAKVASEFRKRHMSNSLMDK